MPELPEVEVTRRGLQERLRDATVRGLRLGKPLRQPLGCDAARLIGCTIGLLGRRGKYLWMPLNSPQGAEAAGGLLWHLGMSGSMRWGAVEELGAPGAHDHVDLLTDRGLLRLTDPRRFGAVIWSPGLDQPPAARLLARLGVEPLSDDFDAEVLQRGFAGRSIAVKPALLAGDVVVGVGNIYCSEALFLAGIHPLRPAGTLSRQECQRLVAAIGQTLARALELGGSTLRDFHNVHGVNGNFQGEARAYGREGQPCLRCDGRIERLVQGQRSTFCCTKCQH